MHLVRTIPTPWAPYSVTFSRDGTRLAIGGGSFYGQGGIMLVDLVTGNSHLSPTTDFAYEERSNSSPTISGVCFANDDRHLAVSSWNWRHHYGPTYLFSVEELRLTPSETLARDYRDEHSLCPTGVLLTGRHVLSRNHGAREVENIVAMWNVPRGMATRPAADLQHLTSHRLIVARDHVITEGRGPEERWREGGGFEEIRPPDGLVLVPLRTGVQQTPVTIPVENCRRVRAIAVDRGRDAFFTGGSDGELDRWRWDGEWRRHRLRGVTNRPEPDWPDLDVTWATYNSNSIAGICSLCGGDGWLSIAADGELCLWERDRLVESWMLPEPGTPRSIAAHPDRPWVAVGIKKGGFGRPQSAVAIVEVSPFQPYQVAGPWSSTVLRLAEALAAGEDCRLPMSDALEESGHAELAVHFRERRSHTAGCSAAQHILNT